MMYGICYRTLCPVATCEWSFDYGVMTALALVDRVCETHLAEAHPDHLLLIKTVYEDLEKL